MNVKTIFFDMGNTLLDFHRGPPDEKKEMLGLIEMSKYLSEISDSSVTEKDLNDNFLKPWLSFIIPRRKELLVEFPIEDFLTPFLEKRRISITRSQMVECLIRQSLSYRNHLVMEDDLEKTLSALKEKNTKLCVISNSCNYDEVNLAHFESMQIKHYFSNFTFSYGVKYRKPRPEIFQAALLASKSEPKFSLMVGDSLKADVLGAQNLGMKTVWYNPQGKLNKTSIRPDFEVSKLSELARIL